VSQTTAAPRTPTAVDRIADAHVEAVLEASPITATYLGVPGHHSELDDFSPEGFAEQARLARRALRSLEDAHPVDAVDEVTIAAMRERLGLEIETHEAGFDRMELNVIASPLQSCRNVLDLMPTATADDW
jgi:hypothetical protein